MPKAGTCLFVPNLLIVLEAFLASATKKCGCELERHAALKVNLLKSAYRAPCRLPWALRASL